MRSHYVRLQNSIYTYACMIAGELPEYTLQHIWPEIDVHAVNYVLKTLNDTHYLSGRFFLDMPGITDVHISSPVIPRNIKLNEEFRREISAHVKLIHREYDHARESLETMRSEILALKNDRQFATVFPQIRRIAPEYKNLVPLHRVSNTVRDVKYCQGYNAINNIMSALYIANKRVKDTKTLTINVESGDDDG